MFSREKLGTRGIFFVNYNIIRETKTMWDLQTIIRLNNKPTKQERNKMNVQNYGDELLTADANGDNEKVFEMWRQLYVRDESNEFIIALHKYENERIADKTVGAAVVDCCHTLKAQGHPMFSQPAKTIEDEKKEVMQWHLDGLITQSELAAKLKSLDTPAAK